MSTLLVSTIKDPADGSTITVPTSGTFFNEKVAARAVVVG